MEVFSTSQGGVVLGRDDESLTRRTPWQQHPSLRDTPARLAKIASLSSSISLSPSCHLPPLTSTYHVSAIEAAAPATRLQKIIISHAEEFCSATIRTLAQLKELVSPGEGGEGISATPPQGQCFVLSPNTIVVKTSGNVLMSMSSISSKCQRLNHHRVASSLLPTTLRSSDLHTRMQNSASNGSTRVILRFETTRDLDQWCCLRRGVDCDLNARHDATRQSDSNDHHVPVRGTRELHRLRERCT